MSTTPVKTDDTKLFAILAWVFAPITSYIWKDHENALVKNHARESFYVGVLHIFLAIAIFFLQILAALTLGFIGFDWLVQAPLALLGFALSVAMVIVRIVGIIKAINGEQWTVPYVSQYLSKYIKL
jgi:uncharacterized Tic20 family protein